MQVLLTHLNLEELSFNISALVLVLSEVGVKLISFVC